MKTNRSVLILIIVEMKTTQFWIPARQKSIYADFNLVFCYLYWFLIYFHLFTSCMPYFFCLLYIAGLICFHLKFCTKKKYLFTLEFFWSFLCRVFSGIRISFFCTGKKYLFSFFGRNHTKLYFITLQGLLQD